MKLKVLLAGGGTGGPVVPLLAVAEKIKDLEPATQFMFVGTKRGPEQFFVSKFKYGPMAFVHVPAGKLRRYFSWQNFAAPFLVALGFLKAIYLVLKFQPNVVFAAGGYVSVPVIFAAKLLGKKVIIHQQDIVPSLTNRLLGPIANKITVAFESSLKDFYYGSGFFGFNNKKVIWTGNPYRQELLKKYTVQELNGIKEGFGIGNDLPVLFVFGGGTGALGINLILKEALPELTRYFYIIHASGDGKQINTDGLGDAEDQANIKAHYRQFILLPSIDAAYAVADFVLCRAGLSSITELSILKKVSIIIPMPHSHQVNNALLLKYMDAALVLDQESLSGPELANIMRKLNMDGPRQRELSENISKIMPKDAAERIAKIIMQMGPK